MEAAMKFAMKFYVVVGKMDCCLLKIASVKKHPSKNTRSYRGGLVFDGVSCITGIT